MIHLLVTSSIADAETISFGPVFTTARINHVMGYLKDVEYQFNQEKDLKDDSRVILVVEQVEEPSEPLFPDGDLRALGAAALAMLRRQYREQYEEMQNV